MERLSRGRVGGVPGTVRRACDKPISQLRRHRKPNGARGSSGLEQSAARASNETIVRWPAADRERDVDPGVRLSRSLLAADGLGHFQGKLWARHQKVADRDWRGLHLECECLARSGRLGSSRARIIGGANSRQSVLGFLNLANDWDPNLVTFSYSPVGPLIGGGMTSLGHQVGERESKGGRRDAR